MGRVAELLAQRDPDGSGIAVIDAFRVAVNRHDRFGMPYLIRHQGNASFVIIHTKVRVFLLLLIYAFVRSRPHYPGYRV